jgi:hypothetical protein
MGQDSWNLQYGTMHPARYRRGSHTDMHPDEGYGGPKMIPGYAGAYKNWKGKVLGKKAPVKPDGNPRTYGPNTDKKSIKYVRENGEFPVKSLKRRK